MSSFKDNFSKQADIYIKYRPLYPTAVYSFLSSLTVEHELALDCGTGNGQAAIGLTAFYKKVIATDPSEQQIKNCLPDKNITYLVEKAEQTSLLPNSVDLITIANALHWFDFDIFYEEAKRVLKNNGVIAAWTMSLPSISPEIDPIIRRFHDYTVDAYWQPENRLVEKEYTTIPFPFQIISSPEFYSEKEMDLDELIGYLNTWSATQRFITDRQFNPTEQLKKELMSLWPDSSSKKKLTWRLIVKVGRVTQS
ncbi:MAG: methyltransferase protein [Bacteroidetes bacterium]|jgi:SAM-dependent methyltransferase|nr:methyltransferase protein [Bacteroidota bacterium]MDF2452679.1 methyltransferase protein [Bacteroidota bacterium]